MGVRAILAHPLHSFGQNAHDEATLVGRLLLADDDYRAGELLPDDMLKKLSEAKLLSANPKFASTFNFVARCFVMILTNPGQQRARFEGHGYAPAGVRFQARDPGG